MNCREAGEMFSPGLDRQLAREEELELQEHLESCPVCRREFSEWKQVADALRRLNEEEITAPAGFASSLMTRIEREKVHPARADWKRWKQAAIGTAAALLLAGGSLVIRTDHIMQVADRDKQVNQVQNSQPDAVNKVDSGKTGTTGGVSKPETGSHKSGGGSTTTDPGSSGSSAPGVSSPVEFTSDQNHVIVSTFLTVKVKDTRKSEAAAIGLAQAGGASIHSLGQQSQGGVVYLVDKIVVDRNGAQQLIQNLSNLGVSSSTEEQENVTERYSEMYSSLITLKNQRLQTLDSDQAAGLDRQISQIEEQLRSWDKQASQQTIVLWLQQI